MEAQGYEIDKNILFQDNKSTMLLEKNGKKSSKRTRALDIRYFFITDQITRNTMDVEYCPGTEMAGDYMTKPLQGKLFAKFKRAIMGHWIVPHSQFEIARGRSVLTEGKSGER